MQRSNETGDVRMMRGSTKSTGGLSVGGMSTFDNPLAGDNELIFDVYNDAIFNGNSKTRQSAEHYTVLETVTEDRRAMDNSRNNNDSTLLDSESRKKAGFLPSGMSMLTNSRRSKNKMAPSKPTLLAADTNSQSNSNGKQTSPNLSAQVIKNGSKSGDLGAADSSLSLHTNGRGGASLHNQLEDTLIGAPAEFGDDHVQRVASQATSDSEGVHSKRKMTPAPPPPATTLSPHGGQPEVSSKQRHAPPVPSSSAGHPHSSVKPNVGQPVLSSASQPVSVPVNNSQSPLHIINPAVDLLKQDAMSTDFRSAPSATTCVGESTAPSYMTSSYSRVATEIDTSNSIVKRADFRQRLEAIMSSRGSGASSVVSSVSKRHDNTTDTGVDIRRPLAGKRHNRGVDTDLSADTIISQVFRKALENYENEGTMRIGDNKTHATASMVDEKNGSKFKFPVVGIDVPDTPDMAELAPSERQKTDEDETSRLMHIRRGFSYLPDVSQAAEVSRRAAVVASRKPHESVLTRTGTSSSENKMSEEEAILQQARAKLHHSELLPPPPPPPPPTMTEQRDHVTRPTAMFQEMMDKVRSRQMKLNLASSDTINEIDEDTETHDRTASGFRAKLVDDDVRVFVERPHEGASSTMKNFETTYLYNAHGDFGDAQASFTANGITRVDTNAQETWDTLGHGGVPSSVRDGVSNKLITTESSRSFLVGHRGAEAGKGKGVAYTPSNDTTIAGSRSMTAASDSPAWPISTPSAAAAAAGIQVPGYEYKAIDRSHHWSGATAAAGPESSRVNVTIDVARVDDSNNRSQWSSPTVILTGNGLIESGKPPTPLSLGFISSGSGDDLESGTSFSDAELTRVRRLTTQSARRRRQNSNPRDSFRYRRDSPDNSSSNAFNEQPFERVGWSDSTKIGRTTRGRAPVSARTPVSVNRLSSTESRPVTVEISPGFNRTGSRASSAGRRLRNALQSAALTSYYSEPHLAFENPRRQSAVIGIVRNPLVQVSRTRPSSAGNVAHADRERGDRLLQLGYSSDPEYRRSVRDVRATYGIRTQRPHVNWSRDSLTTIGQGSIEFNANQVQPVRMAVVGWSPAVTPQFAPLNVHPVETRSSREWVNPQLEDVGKSNGSYFVQMKLNTSGGDAGVTINGGSHGRPSPSVSSSTGFAGATLYQPNYGTVDRQTTDFRHVSVANHAHANENDVGNFRNGLIHSVVNSAAFDHTHFDHRDTGPQYVITNARDLYSDDDRRATRVATGSHVTRSASPADTGLLSVRQLPAAAVSFDIELQSVRREDNRRVTGNGNRPTSYFDQRAPAGKHGSHSSSPRYSLQLNDTMTFDIDAGGPRQTTRRAKQQRSAQRRRRVRSDEEQLHEESHQWTQSSTKEPASRLSQEHVVQNGHNVDRIQRSNRTIPIYVQSRNPVTNGVHHSGTADGGDTSDEIEDLAKHLSTFDGVDLTSNGRRQLSRDLGGRQPSRDQARDQEDSRSQPTADRLPRVVHGSILIRNAIDTTGGPRHVDVVTDGSSSSSGIIVEDNTNMFDGLYRQSRENPMYLSDDDDGDVRPGGDHRRPPARASVEQVFQEERRMTTGSARLEEDDGVSSDFDDFDHEIPISKHRRSTNRISLQLSRDHRQSTYQRPPPLVATPNGVRQTVDVQRDQEEIIGPASNDPLPSPTSVNVDAVSEKVDVSLEGGLARITVCVRCERVVPIRGSDDMFKKSAVVVTRLIEIDMMATAERRRLYDHAVELQGHEDESGTGGRLSAQNTFELYKVLTRIAEQPSLDDGDSKDDISGSRLPAGGSARQVLHIERLLEEQRRRGFGSSLFNDDFEVTLNND